MNQLIFPLLFLPFILCGQDKQLEIVGHGHLTASPDVGVLHVSISAVRDGFGESIEALTEKETKVYDLIESLSYSLDDVKSSQYSVGPNTILEKRREI